MINRLKIFIKNTGKTERAFALSCGIAQNTMSYYLTGQRKPSYEAVEKILIAYPQLSSDWLIRGEGSMLTQDETDNDISDVNAERVLKLVDTIATLQDTINSKSETIAVLNERIKQLENQLNK